MARSYRTTPPPITARRRARLDHRGEPIPLRIQERKPYQGDIHPVPAKALRLALRNIPEHYTHGLERIELRPRESEIGSPFGWYRIREKEIILYSLPMVWHLEKLGALENTVRQYFAKVERYPGGGATVTWPAPEVLGLWFFHDVVTHELGHHYVEQYSTRRKRPASVAAHEVVAELHSYRLSVDWFRRVRAARTAEKTDRDH